MTSTVEMIAALTDRALGRGSTSVLVAPRPSHDDFNLHVEALRVNATVASMPTPAGRLGFLKRLVLAPSRFFLVRQQAANLAGVGALQAVHAEIEYVRAELEQEQRRSVAALAVIEALVKTSAGQQVARTTQIESRLSALETRFESVSGNVESALAPIRDDIGGLRSWLASDSPVLRRVADIQHLQTGRIANLERRSAVPADVLEFAVGAPAGTDAPIPATSPDGRGSGLSDEFYARLESHFRPGEHVGDGAVADYLDLFRDRLFPTTPLLDLGCGRGDFVLALVAAGFPAIGVDTNAEAVREAKLNGLEVEQSDAVDYLRSCRPGSLGAVTMMHVAEHIDAATLLLVLDLAMTALVPGGTIVIETPNPTNVLVGAGTFYNDPTHVRPLTPDYLAFAVADRGFVEVQTRFLHPRQDFEKTMAAIDEGVEDSDMLGLMRDLCWSLQGPLDFAVIGRRGLPPPSAATTT
jgi:2-polyprenyl-3-methyl-5-hydroxy-6-metoxy-1,4-benzoquinol methylase